MGEVGGSLLVTHRANKFSYQVNFGVNSYSLRTVLSLDSYRV